MPISKELIEVSKLPWFPIFMKELGYVPVRYGRWVEAKYPLFTCSECGATYQDTGYGYNYCPNCGAKMDEVEDAE